MLTLISLELLLSIYLAAASFTSPTPFQKSDLHDCTAVASESVRWGTAELCARPFPHPPACHPLPQPRLSKTALLPSWALGVKALKASILDNSIFLPVISPELFRYYNKVQDDSAGALNWCIRISHMLAVCYLLRLPFRQFRFLCKHCKTKCLIFKTCSSKKLVSALLVRKK